MFSKAGPGVDWLEMHKLAERVVLQGLVDLGLLTGDVAEMQEKRIGFIFMPHGLGHLIGLDVHDVGGYLSHTPKRNPLPGLKNLRFARPLEPGMLFTIEPGCYFRDFLLQGEVPSDFYQFDLKYLNLDKIHDYMKEVQGVRIEDVVLVTDQGVENLSWQLPRSVDQIEKCMAGQAWEAI